MKTCVFHLLPLIAFLPVTAGQWRIIDVKSSNVPRNVDGWLSSAMGSGTGVRITTQLSPTSSHEDRGKVFISKGTWTLPPDALRPSQKLFFQLDLGAEKVELGGHWHLGHSLTLSASNGARIAYTETGTAEGAPKRNRATGEWTVPEGSAKGKLDIVLDAYPGGFKTTYTYAWSDDGTSAGGSISTGTPAGQGSAAPASGTPPGSATSVSGKPAGKTSSQTTGGSLTGTSVTYDEPSGFTFPGSEVELLRNGDDGSVSNGGKEAVFTLNRPARLTYVLTYHYNGGKGAPGGTLKIVGSQGEVWGPWKVETVNKIYWIARPNVSLPAGTYRVVDSDPATWAQNGGSHGQGHIILKGMWGIASAKSAPVGKPSSTQPASTKSLKEELTELKELFDGKLISQQEYDAQRAVILRKHGMAVQ